ncbi:MAG: hypothetical protein LBQ89_03155 [Treponema sp.]|nr:hypothetical protein [Treponema sp.]
MYYTASSVLAVLTHHPALSIDYTDPQVPFPVPSCPKVNDPRGHCRNDFPICEGEKIDCKQKLFLINQNGDPYLINFLYFISSQTRDGRVKKENAGLKRIRLIYGLDENALVDA